MVPDQYNVSKNVTISVFLLLSENLVFLQLSPVYRLTCSPFEDADRNSLEVSRACRPAGLWHSVHVPTGLHGCCHRDAN